MNANSNSLTCAIRGPVMLITVGALFAFNNFTPYGFGSTWPVLLIVFGLLTLLCRGANPAVPEPPVRPAAPPPYAYQAPPPVSYRQSQYNQPPAGTAQGGTSTPQSPADPGRAPEQPGGGL